MYNRGISGEAFSKMKRRAPERNSEFRSVVAWMLPSRWETTSSFAVIRLKTWTPFNLRRFASLLERTVRAIAAVNSGLMERQHKLFPAYITIPEANMSCRIIQRGQHGGHRALLRYCHACMLRKSRVSFPNDIIFRNNLAAMTASIDDDEIAATQIETSIHLEMLFARKWQIYNKIRNSSFEFSLFSLLCTLVTFVNIDLSYLASPRNKKVDNSVSFDACSPAIFYNKYQQLYRDAYRDIRRMR